MKSNSLRKGMLLYILTLSFYFMEAQPTTISSVALDKMNVLYIGVDNPVTIAVSGFKENQIVFSITDSGGSITKTGPGKYNVRVTKPTDECWVNLSVGKKSVGKSKFRVRNIPRPVAQVGSYESGSNTPAGAFKAQAGVAVFSPNFAFDLAYKVTGFTISSDTQDGFIDEATCQGNTWSTEAKKIISALRPGSTVMIDEIRAIGPDGRTQRLPSLVYYIR